MKNVIAKEDYEFYTIPFPVKMLLGRKRRKFLFNELEKLHPCFSSLCAFDYKMRIGRKGLKTDVIVMNRLKLAEIKKKSGYAGLKIPETRKRFFVSKRNKKIIQISLFLFLCALIVFWFLGFEKLFSYLSAEKSVEVNSFVENQNLLSENLDLGKENESLVKEFFEIVRKSSGKISSFEWKNSDGYEFVNCSLSNIFPEKFEEKFTDYMECSNVIYKTSVPFFSIKIRRKLNNIFFAEKINFENSENIKFLEAVRKICSENSDGFIQLLEENSNNFIFNFLMGKNQSEAENFFEKLNQVCNDSGFCCSEFFLEDSDENNFFLKLQFVNKSFLNFNFFEELVLNLENFGFIKKLNSSEAEQNELQVPEKSKNYESFVKLGEVNYRDGKKSVFYKNPEGKIIKEEI